MLFTGLITDNNICCHQVLKSAQVNCTGEINNQMHELTEYTT